MRIRFAAPRYDRAESRLDAAAVEAFYRELENGDCTEPARFERTLGAALARVAPGIRVEVDALSIRERRVVVAPDGDDGLEPLAVHLVAGAPKRAGIAVVRHRPPLDVDPALADVQSRTDVDLSRARARLGFSRGHLLEVVVYAPSFASAADERALGAANLLVSRLVGDERFDDWIGAIDVAPLPRGGSLRVLSDGSTSPDATLRLNEILPAVEAAIRGVDAELPDAPYHAFCERAEWTLLELEPDVSADYAAQDDVALVSTMLPEAMKSFLQGSRFSSRRFSKHGERFAYVKVDAQSKTIQERHELRVDLEDAINTALVPGRLGCVVGAGIGARYLYLHLALERLEHGIEVARKRLQKQGVDRRAWILFCDAGWHAEWVGIWDDADAPP